MLTYQLQRRQIAAEDNFVFPAKLELTVIFDPPYAFGGAPGLSRVLKTGASHISFDVHSGRALADNDPPLPKVSSRKTFGQMIFELNGNVLQLQCPCPDASWLSRVLSLAQLELAAILNLYFADAPVIRSIEGKVGDAPFQLVVGKTNVVLNSSTPENFLRNGDRAIDLVHAFGLNAPPRIAAALQYFYIANRLMIVGNTLWEFMAEIILNYCKSLEVLFGNTRDDVASGLKALSYTEDQIRTIFMPLLILRSHMDVAHPKLQNDFSHEQLDEIYDYLAESNSRLQTMFAVIVERYFAGTLTLPDYQHQKDTTQIDKLMATIRARPKTEVKIEPEKDQPDTRWRFDRARRMRNKRKRKLREQSKRRNRKR